LVTKGWVSIAISCRAHYAFSDVGSHTLLRPPN
jgi:hypothetical protein